MIHIEIFKKQMLKSTRHETILRVKKIPIKMGYKNASNIKKYAIMEIIFTRKNKLCCFFLKSIKV